MKMQLSLTIVIYRLYILKNLEIMCVKIVSSKLHNASFHSKMML